MTALGILQIFKSTVRKHYKHLFANKYDNLHQMDKIFGKIPNDQRLPQRKEIP